MSTVGSVVIAFGAGTAGYFAGSKAVKDDAASVSGAFGGVTGSMAALFGGIGAGLSVGAVVAGLKSAGEAVINLAHDAAKLSVSTDELSRLRFADKETGVDAETLSHAMLKLQVETGKAATEGGEAAAKFSALGLNAKQLANENPANEFRDIAASIASIHNPAERAAAEVALFGKSGAELGPLLAQGATGLAAMSDEADRLGVTVSAVDAESTLRAGRAVDKVSEAISGVGQHIAAGLAPYVEDAANRMAAWAEEGGRMGRIVNGAITGIEYTAAGLITTWDMLNGAVEVAGGVGVAAFAMLTKGVTLAADAGAWLSNNIFGTHFDTSGIDAAADHFGAIAEAMEKEGANTISDAFAGKSAAKVFEYFDGVQAKAKQASDEAVKAHQQIAGAFDVPEASENIKGETIQDYIVTAQSDGCEAAFIVGGWSDDGQPIWRAVLFGKPKPASRQSKGKRR